MDKNISLNKFIFIQLLIMVIILFLYLIYIVPYVKPMCYDSGLCSNAFNCSCNNKKCLCDYIDETRKNVQIECELRD